MDVWRRGTQDSRLSSERGQILPLLAAGGLIVLLGFTALVLDVGHAQLVKHRLQAAADAAALAGAQELYASPDRAPAVAADFGARGKNAPGGGDTAAPGVVTAVCSRPGPSCANDTLVVAESADVQTSFARVFGINTFHVRAKAAACGPCSGLPLDVMILLDRTGSMSDGDMNNAQRGIETLLRYLNPRFDRVGFAVTPPAVDMHSPYDADPDVPWYPLGTDANYVLVGLTTDYKRPDGTLDMSSPLVSTIEGVHAGGATGYGLALQQASAELDRNTRYVDGKPVHKVLIFMSDGAANAAQLSAYPDPKAGYDDSWDRSHKPVSWSPYITQPCGEAVDVASQIRGPDPKTGTEIFTIGYGIDKDSGENQCFEAQHYSHDVSVKYGKVREGMTARQALQSIASPEKDHFLEPAQGQDLRNIFADIAGAILPPKLIPVPAGT